MSHFFAGILRITFLEAGAALLILQRVSGRVSRRVTIAFVVLAAIALFSWTRFGALRDDGDIVHRWEQYHFYLSAKYLPEVRYAGLYTATLLADRESGRAPATNVTRDLTSFEEISVDQALEGSPEVRARFSAARWADFKADWAAVRARGAPWGLILKDHGNTGSPAWALFAAPIAAMIPYTEAGERVLALIDVALLLVLFVAFFRSFGARAAAVAIWVFAFVPFTFDFLFGSFLRWDWLFALGMSLCMWKRGRTLTAGAFFGYAVVSKLFPIFFGIALAIKAAQDILRTRRIAPRFVRFAAGAALAAGLSVGASMAVFGGPSIWTDYKARIDVAQHEKFYANQYSFQTVFLQLRKSTAAEFFGAPFTPAEIKQGRGDVDIRDHEVSFLMARLALTLLLVWLVARGDELGAFAAGPFFIFVWLTVNAYYWNMLALPALAWATRDLHERRGLATLLGLHLLLMAYYLFQHVNRGYAEGYFVACMMLLLIGAWALEELTRGRFTDRRSSSPLCT